MIELFLFINPIGPICYDIEKEILNRLNTNRKKSICRSYLSLIYFQ